MSHPRSSRILITLALAAALVTAGLVATPVVEQSAEASVGAVHVAPRSVTDDTVLGAFAPVGEGLDIGAPAEVYTLATQGDDTLYVGGSFSTAIGVPGTVKIAAWANADDTWHAVGGGTTGDVNALAVWGDDTVYAGGYFPSAGGVSGTRKIAAWSIGDDTWRSLGGDLSSSDNVTALAVQGDDTAYAGGDFSTMGGVTGTRAIAARSNRANTWNSLGGGATSGGTVYALAIHGDDTVYAGGGFNTLGGVTATSRIAAWSNVDDTWHSLGGGATSGGTVYALAIHGDDTVYAGGNFNTLGGVAGTSRIAAWSNADDTWHSLGGGIGSGEVDSFAIDDAHGLVYAGGTFTSIGSVSVNSVAVWDIGISAWIPMQAEGGIGVTPSGPNVYAMALMGSSVYLGGNFTTAGGIPTSKIAKWTWGAPTAQAVPATGGNATTIQVRGSRLIGVSGVHINGSPVTYTRDDSTTISVTIPSNLYDGTYSVQVDAVGGTATTAYTVTGAPPPPPPVYPPSPPLDVEAVGGDAASTVSWTPPSDSGSFPITTYEVSASPGGRSCLVSAPTLTCQVSGLTNGTTYTFAVRALNGAGWGSTSAPSNAVTPTASAATSIVITGSRNQSDMRYARVTGSTTGLAGEQVTPYVRFPGEQRFTIGKVTRPVSADGTFDWERRTLRKVFVYFTHGSVRSNIVVIPAR